MIQISNIIVNCQIEAKYNSNVISLRVYENNYRATIVTLQNCYSYHLKIRHTR